MVRKLGGTASNPESLTVWSRDQGVTWSDITCGPRELPEGLIDRLIEGLGDSGIDLSDYQIRALGTAVVCLQLKPPVDTEVVTLLATMVAQELEVPFLTYRHAPLRTVDEPPQQIVRVLSLREQG